MAPSSTLLTEWLHLAEVASTPNLFFLGAADRRITFYSQQVRALRLVHALSEAGRVSNTTRVAVVGAGAAGTTAALALALCDARVDLIDQAGEILQLQSHSERLLHPHIYDWPRRGSLRSDAVLPFLDWSRGSGGTVCAEMRQDFNAAKTNLQKLRFRGQTCLIKIDQVLLEWELWLVKDGIEKAEAYDLVIVALGFGDEKPLGAAPLNDYWKTSGVGTPATEVSRTSYFLSGNGDGGLADAMATLINDFEHLSFTEEFLGQFPGPSLPEAAIKCAEKTLPDGDLRPVFIELVLPILERRDALQQISTKLRSDRTVTFNCGGPIFANGRAALLNQVMAFAVFEAARNNGREVIFTTGKVTNVAPDRGKYGIEGVAPASGVLGPFDQVILRHGPDRQKRYSSCTPFYNAYTQQIQQLQKTKPEAFVPPELHPGTFSFFEELHLQKLTDPQQRSARISLRHRRISTLMLSMDGAAQVLVQQGNDSLESLARNCEALVQPAVIYLALPHGKIHEYVDILLRLSKASQGMIRLEADQGHILGWRKVFPTMPSQTLFTTPYPVSPLPCVVSLWEELDNSLIRQLNTSLSNICNNGKCPVMGSIHATILIGLQPTWNGWVSAMAVNKKLQSDFLRMLVSIDGGSNSGWDGDVACLPDLAAALVLMLATHVGEALQPGICDRGNLHFRGDAVGLGSSCRAVSGTNIADLKDPEDWSVDALILSGTNEEIFPVGGLVGYGGIAPTSLTASVRVAPAVIQNSSAWRLRLRTGLAAWSSAVQEEFDQWKQRQDSQLRS
jgi:hypothetical protein